MKKVYIQMTTEDLKQIKTGWKLDGEIEFKKSRASKEWPKTAALDKLEIHFASSTHQKKLRPLSTCFRQKKLKHWKRPKFRQAKIRNTFLFTQRIVNTAHQTYRKSKVCQLWKKTLTLEQAQQATGWHPAKL